MGTVTERLAILISVSGGSQAEGQLKRVGGAFGGLTKGQVSFGVAAAAAGKFLLAAGQAASNLGEQVSATNVIFGEGAQQVQDFAKGAADSLGLSQRAALEAANSFASLFKSAGLNAKDTAQFSTTLASLGADISSLRNVSQGDVLAALRSGLTGEVEPLRRLGILLNDNSVQAKAMEMGLASANGTVDDGAKVLARLNLILEQTKDAQGDAARTADSAANAQRHMAAEFENFQATLGQAVAPAMAEVATSLSDMISAANDALEPIGGMSKTIGTLARVSIAGATLGLSEMTRGMGDHKDKAEKVREATEQYRAALSNTANVQRQVTTSEKDLVKAQKETEDSAWKLMHVQEALADAHKDVDRAARDERQAQADLDRLLQQGAVDTKKVADAQRNLADATKGVESALAGQAKAQANLDRVKKGSSPRDIRKAELDLADAKRNQQKATLGVADAQDELNSIVTVGLVADEQRVGTTRSVEEAQLALDDALQGVEESSIATADAQDRLAELQNAGKEGSDSLRDAQQELADATDRVVEAQRNQADAQEELRKAQEGDPDFADKVSAAQDRLRDAIDKVADSKRNERDATHELADAQERENTAKEKAVDLRKNAGGIGRAGTGTDVAGGLLRDAADAGGGFLGALAGALTLNVPLHIDGREVAKATVTYTADELAKMARRAGLS